MKTVGIVAEYNPFHNGHLYHIEQIRRTLGADVAIIAVMSGNYTQRAEPAFFHKADRAACAIRCGVDLVLELPFPFSSAAAETFAQSSVSILKSIGDVDFLSFGSESGDIEAIRTVSERLCCEDFSRARQAAIDRYPELGHARITEMTYRELYGDGPAFTPNNILAFEYLSALHACHSRAVPHTVTRIGGSYSADTLSPVYSGASAIRRAIECGNGEALAQLPPPVAETVADKMQRGHLPTSMQRIYPAIAAKFLLGNGVPDVPDGGDGLYFRLCSTVLQATDLQSFIERTQTKRHTRSRIRRVILNTLLGVTSSDLSVFPRYTQLLGASPTGLSLLKQIKDRTDFPILTKPSDADKLPDGAMRQKALSDLADRLYCLTLPVPSEPYSALTYTPYIHK